MIHLKHNVRLHELAPQVVLALQVADALWRRYDVLECWVTSCNDSQHKTNSFHFKGLAVDLRSHTIPTLSIKQHILNELRAALGKDFDVLLESENTANEHYHIEWDPKE